MSADAVKTTRTTCPYCGVGCGVLAKLHPDGPLEGQVDIEGDPKHPANFGRLCSKGSALGETLSMEDRLLYPEIAGERASWDIALDLVAGKFADAVKEHGPDSVAFYVSGQILTEDYYAANKLMKGYIGSANIDTNSRLCMASSVAGHRRAFGADTVPGTYEDLEEADLLVLVGSNLAWCHPVIFQRVEAAKAANPAMRVVVIDPRETATCAIADLHLALKPDTDAILFNGLLAQLSEAGVFDQAYIEAHTEGLQPVLQAIGPCQIGHIADKTGLSPQDIALFFGWVAQTEKTVTVYSQGVNQSVIGTDKVNAIINTHLATGRIGRVGMGPFSITGQPNAMGGREVGGLANMLAAHMALENPSHRALVQEFWQSPTIADKQGLKAVDLFKAAKDGKIKALWIMATNPVDSLPDADQVAEALRVCPFVVVSDVTYASDTVAYADVLLPALGWGEKDGTVTNSERRISRQKAFLKAPGEAKADWWQLAQVAQKMGFSGFDWPNAAAVFREHAQLSAYKNHGQRDFDIGGLADVSDATYDDLEPVQWPVVAGTAPTTTRFFANGGFYTPSGKAQFIKATATTGKKTEKRFPLILNTGRIRDQWHTMTRTGKTGRLTSHFAEPYCEIHPAKAADLGIKIADLVEVTSPYGKMIVRALITDRVAENAVFIPMHWTDQFASKGRVDALVAPETDPFSGQPGSKFTPVHVKPLSYSWYGFAVLAEKPTDLRCHYWALAPIGNGWRLEFAGVDSPSDREVLVKSLVSTPYRDDTADWMSVRDPKQGLERHACWQEGSLKAALFFASEPVEVSRAWACELLSRDAASGVARAEVLAGRPKADQPDPGPLVCSCFSIGRNQILDAVATGANSVKEVGLALKAGTNCGSCRSEIQSLLNESKSRKDAASDFAEAG